LRWWGTRLWASSPITHLEDGACIECPRAGRSGGLEGPRFGDEQERDRCGPITPCCAGPAPTAFCLVLWNGKGRRGVHHRLIANGIDAARPAGWSFSPAPLASGSCRFSARCRGSRQGGRSKCARMRPRVRPQIPNVSWSPSGSTFTAGGSTGSGSSSPRRLTSDSSAAPRWTRALLPAPLPGPVHETTRP